MSAANRTFGGRYATIGQVGSGGMAEVYRARDELLGREVALKVLNERLSRDRAFVERFRREAQSAANLNHPNVVSLYDYGADDGTYFIVMEFIDGRPLSDIVRDEGPLMPERAAEIGADVARALERAHQSGLVHRDIKPANIMITNSGQTKVTDFGIARAATGDKEATVTQTGMVIGTAAYLSPEQAQGDRVDARSDIYSLGCVLYEMLTGQPPFSGDSPLSVAYKHVRENAEPPSSKNPDVPPELDAITMKALAKNPHNRYQSAAELESDLQRLLAGQTVQATPVLADQTLLTPAPATRTEAIRMAEDFDEEPERRSPLPYVLVALVILALFGLIAWALFNNLMGGETVRVPDLVDRDVDEAEQILERRGLEAEIEETASRKPVDQVIEQDPPAGEMVEEGATVTLVVSTGPETTEVPDVTGERLRAARQAIRDAELRVGQVSREPSDEVPKGVVIRQFPSGGREAIVRSRVDLVVSSGPAPVTVPSVIGQTEDEATAALEDAGLGVEVETEPNDADEGTVIAQDPEAGEQVPPGTVVRIVVSEGPEEQEMPDVRGMDADEAEDLLEDEYGLVVEREDADEPCPQPPGTVCEQDPEPGKKVKAGDEVTIFVQPGSAAIGGAIAFV